MGGTADNSQRSSSPLKRRASDLENETTPSSKDVDMISVLSSVRSNIESMQPDQNQDIKSPETMKEVSSDDLSNTNMNFRQQMQTPSTISTETPDICQQIKTITSIIETENKRQLNEGDMVYLVSNRWLQRVKDCGTEPMKAGKIGSYGDIGPIDNSDIILQLIKDATGTKFVQLKPGLGLSEFTPFPESAWILVMEWYGIMPGTIPITRIAHNTNPHGAPNIIFEFYPLVFKIHRLFMSENPSLIPLKASITTADAPIIVSSRTTKWVDFLRVVKNQTGINLEKKLRVWRVPRQHPVTLPVSAVTNTATPPSSRPGSPTNAGELAFHEPQDSWTKLLLDVSTFVKLEISVARELIDAEDVSTDIKYNGSRDLSLVGLGEDQTLVLDESLSASHTWVSNFMLKSARTSSTVTTRTGSSLNIQNSNSREIPANSGAMMTRGRAQKSGRTPGTVGLSNLGNTCYMNSALQCIRAVEELTKYFLSGSAMAELNRANPLGNNGEVAMAYQKLLEEIYHKDIVPNSITPRHFRSTIGRYASSFSGYGQQDSQEFLGFLLDGLQEDLSRVKKKPYIEKPDSTDEMVNNPDAIRKMAEEVWDITKKRDDSIISDLFTGMYKSTLVCPECGKVSITFDPFNNLTLQLPIESIWTHNASYFPLNNRPFIMTIEIDKQATVLMLKQYVSSRVGVPVERLFAAEEFKWKFYKFYKDNEIASDVIQNTDHLIVYELEAAPTNWPPPSRLKKRSTSLYDNNELDEVPCWDDPIARRMVVPVIHRRPNPGSPTRVTSKDNRRSWVIECVPHLIILTPDEARNEDSIKRKILEKVATFTTSAEFNYDDDKDNNEVDTDTVGNLNSDALLSSNSDGTASHETKTVTLNEDNIDVNMNDVPRHSEGRNLNPNPLRKPSVNLETSQNIAPFRSKNYRPKWVNHSHYLKPELQNLFQIGYCRGTKELIPSGWNTVDEEKTYPSISSRINDMSQVLDNVTMDDDGSDSRIAGSETSEDDSTKFSGTTRMNEESESEDDNVSTQVTKDLPVRTAGSRSAVAKKTLRARINKQKNCMRAIRSNSSDNVECGQTKDNGPLIRLGEMVIVDWNSQAYDNLFCGNGDDKRGQSTWNKMPSHKDEVLVEKRKNRLQRKKNGISLDDCLDEFGKEETLSEMDTWYCPRCREHRRASKKFELWKTPDILVMHLKRFSSSARRRDKLDIRVDFPIVGLDLTSRVIMQNEKKKEMYDLFAVDNHWGGLGGGHYTAHAKNFHNNEWYEYNDSSVSMLSNLSEIVSSSAYLLFYRRRSDVPLGGPRLQRIIENYDNRSSHSEDEVSELGEDQALVGNSSLSGSSSALIGAGVPHHLRSDSESAGATNLATSDLNHLPSYRPHEEHEEDSSCLLGPQINGELHESIEDEGFAEDNVISYGGFNMHHNSNTFSGGFSSTEWDFSGLGENREKIQSGAGSGDDISSERVQCDSCPSQTSNEDLYKFDDISTVEYDGYIDEVPVPDMDEDHEAASLAIQHDLHDKLARQVTNFQEPQFITGDEDEALDVEIPADIHLEDPGESKVE